MVLDKWQNVIFERKPSQMKKKRMIPGPGEWDSGVQEDDGGEWTIKKKKKVDGEKANVRCCRIE